MRIDGLVGFSVFLAFERVVFMRGAKKGNLSEARGIVKKRKNW